jgi:hypothetical protein
MKPWAQNPVLPKIMVGGVAQGVENLPLNHEVLRLNPVSKKGSANLNNFLFSSILPQQQPWRKISLASFISKLRQRDVEWLCLGSYSWCVAKLGFKLSPELIIVLLVHASYWTWSRRTENGLHWCLRELTCSLSHSFIPLTNILRKKMRDGSSLTCLELSYCIC